MPLPLMSVLTLLVIAIVSWKTAVDPSWWVRLQLMFAGQPFAKTFPASPSNVPVSGVMIWQCIQSGSVTIGYVDGAADVRFMNGRQPPFDSWQIQIGSIYCFLLSASLAMALVVFIAVTGSNSHNARGFPLTQSD